MQIDTLREAVSILTRGAKALKAENVDLRAENGRLRGLTRSKERLEGAELTEVAIPLDVRAPGAARTVVVQCLADHVASSVLDNALLLVSELVTNSVRHSGAAEGDDVFLRIHLWRDMCRLEVEDPGRDGVVAHRPPDSAAHSGMGLNLVQRLSQRWGVIRPPDGPTRVWAQLPCRRALA
jgi:anti-sigma regulatory factor (Ser/Thr protein kinase)